LRVWNLESGRCVRELEGHEAEVHAVVMTADGKRAVSGSLDTTLRIWDLETGTCLRKIEGHIAPVWAIALSADGRRLFREVATKQSGSGTLRQANARANS